MDARRSYAVRLWLTVGLFALALTRAAAAYGWTDDPLARQWHYIGETVMQDNGYHAPMQPYSNYLSEDDLWFHLDISNPHSRGVMLNEVSGTMDQYGGAATLAPGSYLDAVADPDAFDGPEGSDWYARVVVWQGDVRQSTVSGPGYGSGYLDTVSGLMAPVAVGGYALWVNGGPQGTLSRNYSLAHTNKQMSVNMDLVHVYAWHKTAPGVYQYREYEGYAANDFQNPPPWREEAFDTTGTVGSPSALVFTASLPHTFQWYDMRPNASVTAIVSGNVTAAETTNPTIVNEILTAAGMTAPVGSIDETPAAPVPPPSDVPLPSGDASGSYLASGTVPAWLDNPILKTGVDWLLGAVYKVVEPVRGLLFPLHVFDGGVSDAA